MSAPLLDEAASIASEATEGDHFTQGHEESERQPGKLEQGLSVS